MEFTTPIPNTAYPTASREYFRISLALFFWIELHNFYQVSRFNSNSTTRSRNSPSVCPQLV